MERIITVNDKQFWYRVGLRNVTFFNPETNKKTSVSIADLLKLTEEEVERLKRKGELTVTPKIIREYLDNL